ncbi:hypothetical protein ACNKHM_14650 [Shigella sonnei]
MITGQPFTITGIRAGRAMGLLRQHLPRYKRLRKIRAMVEGAELGSQRLLSGTATCAAAITALLSVAPEVVRWCCKLCCRAVADRPRVLK